MNNTVTQGEDVLDASGSSVGVAQFNQNTGERLAPGETVVTQPVSQTQDASAMNSHLSGDSTALQFPETAPDPDYNAAMMSISDVYDAAETQVANQPQTAAEKTQESIGSKLLSAYKTLTGKKEAQLKAEESAGLPGFKKQLTDINSQIQTLQKESAAIPLKLQENVTGRGVTSGGLAPIQTGLLRQNTIKALGLSAIAQTLQGNIATAQATADRAVELEFAPAQAQIDYLSKAYEMNKDTLSREDKKKSDALSVQLQERQRLLDNQKDDKKTVLSFAAEAAKNGAPTVLLNQAMSMNPEQALAALGTYMQDPYDAAIKLQQLRKLRLENDTNSGVLNPEVAEKSGAYATALSTILGSSKFTKDQKNMVVNAINNGEDPFTTIKNQAKNIMGQTEATKLTSYEAADSAMRDLQKNLNAYYDAGGNTGLLSGTFEQVINKLGQVNDPDKVDIATQVAISLQAYRNAISGTAYSNQEGQQISAVFPGINKSHGLNTAIISGRLKADESIIDGIYGSALGAKTYQDLKKAQNSSSSAGSLPPDIDSALQTNAKVDEAAKTVTVPRSVWSTFGANMDAVIAALQAKGYKLLVGN